MKRCIFVLPLFAGFTAVPGRALSKAGISEPMLAARPDIVFFEDFEDRNWRLRWDEAGHSDNCELVGPPHPLPVLGKQCLRITVRANDHYGASLSLLGRNMPGGEPEEIYFRYYLKFDPDWECQGGKLPGFGGTYGRAGWGLRPVHGNDGWSARGLFWRLRGSSVPIGYYVYHADMTGNAGSHWEWPDGGLLKKGVWYCVEGYCKLNTPGKNDGILRGWVNGELAFEKTDIRFRDVPSLKIEKIWFNIYNGGDWTCDKDCHLYIDNVVVARNPIGPFVSVTDLRKRFLEAKKKRTEHKRRPEPKHDEDKAVRAALAKVQALAPSGVEAALEFLDSLRPASTEDAAAFEILRRGLKARPDISAFILDAVQNGAKGKVSVNMMGMNVRVEIVGAEGDALLVSTGGERIPLALSSLPPKTLFSIFSKTAGEEPPGEALLDAASFGLVYGMDRDKVMGLALWLPAKEKFAAARKALLRLLSL